MNQYEKAPQRVRRILVDVQKVCQEQAKIAQEEHPGAWGWIVARGWGDLAEDIKIILEGRI